MNVFPDCNDLLLLGPSGKFKTDKNGVLKIKPKYNSFTKIKYSKSNGGVVLEANAPQTITAMLLRFKKICAGNKPLTVKVQFYNPAWTGTPVSATIQRL